MADLLMIIPIGDTGEEFAVTVEWTPDPQIIESKFVEAANNFGDWSIPLEKARQLMIESTEAHFDSESDPYGRKWVPLDEDYKSYKLKQGYPEDILVRTGRLKEAATGEISWLITENAVFFNTGALPYYGPIHQEGTAPRGLEDIISSLRTGVGLTDEQSRRIVGREISGEGRGNNLPQRMFIGADEVTVELIEQAFLEHLDNTVTDFIDWAPPTPIPGMQVTTTRGFTGTLTGIKALGGGFMVRGAGGRFIKGTFNP